MKYTASSWLAKSLSFFFFALTDKAIVFFFLTQTLQRKNWKDTQMTNADCRMTFVICYQ